MYMYIGQLYKHELGSASFRAHAKT